MSKGQKIGIFAGSFDPVHSGHIKAAEVALKQLELTTVYFVVEPRPRYKQGVKALEHRSEMVRLAIKDNPNLKQIIINEPYCTTEDTLPKLEQRFPGSQFYLLMGDDVARRIADWTHTRELFDSVELVILQRMMDPVDIQGIFTKLEAVRGKRPSYHLLSNEPMSCSSSEVKKRLKAGEVSSDCLHQDVLAYLKQHNIYGSSGLGS
jgi:nicotinate-nucleotide adenylyltransferase